MDIATILGLALALGSIIGGQILEGGHLGSIMQLTAFIIVMGGTIGAVCVQNPLSVVLKGVSLLSLGIMSPKHDNKGIIATIVDLANVSRKQGLLALEGKLTNLVRGCVEFVILNQLPDVDHRFAAKAGDAWRPYPGEIIR